MPTNGLIVDVPEEPRPSSSSDNSDFNCGSGLSEDEDILSSAMSKYRIATPPVTRTSAAVAAQAHQRFESLPVRSEHEPFLRQCIEEILNGAVFGATERKAKVLEWHAPDELEKLFDMQLKGGADSDEKLLDLLRATIRYSVKTGHPYFVNQLFSGVDPYALAGQWLTDALNPSVYTYEVSPVFTLMEEVVLQEMRSIVGFAPNGAGDGIFCPGGSIANGYAISCARYKHMPDVKVSRVYLPTLHHHHHQIHVLISI